MIKNILYSLFIHFLLFSAIYFAFIKKDQKEIETEQEILVSVISVDSKGVPPINEEMEKPEKIEEKPPEKIEEKQEEKKTMYSVSLCKVCYINDINIVFEPCCHAACCDKCVLNLNNRCPICREKIEKSKKIYPS